MARRTQEIRPFSVRGIERGLARGEAREIRKEEQSRQERLDEEARRAREQATRVQGAQLAQGQQRIDIAREQAAAQIQARQLQQTRQAQQDRVAAEERDIGRLERNLIRADTAGDAEGWDSTLAELNRRTGSNIRGDRATIAKILKQQLKAEDEGNEEAADFYQERLQSFNIASREEALERVGRVGEAARIGEERVEERVIAREERGQERALERIEAGAEGDVRQFQSIINSTFNMLNQTDIDENLVVPLGSERRRKLEARAEFYQNKIDESFGFQPAPRPAPAAVPTPTEPSPPTVEQVDTSPKLTSREALGKLEEVENETDFSLVDFLRLFEQSNPGALQGELTQAKVDEIISLYQDEIERAKSVESFIGKAKETVKEAVVGEPIKTDTFRLGE